jgi:hypothetical protein
MFNSFNNLLSVSLNTSDLIGLSVCIDVLNFCIAASIRSCIVVTFGGAISGSISFDCEFGDEFGNFKAVDGTGFVSGAVDGIVIGIGCIPFSDTAVGDGGVGVAVGVGDVMAEFEDNCEAFSIFAC